MTIRSINPKDYDEWLRMRDLLWPGESKTLHKNEMEERLQKSDNEVFVAERLEEGLCGFVEVGTRSWAEGCKSSPVAYIEGWYVDEDMRGKRIGHSLIRKAEKWFKNRGYAEVASDCELNNEASFHIHLACGYEEVIKEIHFRKKL